LSNGASGRILATAILGQDGEIGEGRAAHIVMQHLAAERESRAAVRHQALALGGADGGAQVGLARETRRALPAFRRVERDDVVAGLQRGHARPDLDHDAGALMPEDSREQALGIGARKRELVGVADAGGLDLNQHLAGLWAVELDGFHLERLARLERHRRTHIHCGSP
jgi:hypothetical protein